MDNFDDKEYLSLSESELSSRLIYDGKIIKLRLDDVKLPDGGKSYREYVHHAGGASILAVDGEENVYLVRQFRYPYREVISEIPAGKLEEGEKPICAAARELEEEVGLKAGRIELLGLLYPTPGYTDEHLYVYLATDLEKTSAHLDKDEFLNVRKMPFDEALELVMSGEIHDGKTCFALLKYAMLKNK